MCTVQVIVLAGDVGKTLEKSVSCSNLSSDRKLSIGRTEIFHFTPKLGAVAVLSFNVGLFF